MLSYALQLLPKGSRWARFDSLVTAELITNKETSHFQDRDKVLYIG